MWNYRILVTEHHNELQFNIHEVYYDENEKPNGYTANPVPVSTDSLDGINWILHKMQVATTKPILWGDDRFPEEYKPE